MLFGYDIRVYFLLFIIYAFLGWTMEVVCKLVEDKRFINRGFLIGPYCPIYGYGALLITILLKRYTDDFIVLFVMAIVICGILEYLTSYFMEKIFKARWWDYSNNKFNINGRICLETIIPFGILGLLIMYILNPFFIGKIENIPEIWLNILFWVILVIFLCDNIISGIVMRYVKKTERVIEKNTDNTEEMTEKVKEILRSKSVLHRRLVNAYPKLQTVKVKIRETKEEIKKKERVLRKNIEEKSKNIKNKVKFKNEDENRQ